jgi:Arc/MetJ family transcription regulator
VLRGESDDDLVAAVVGLLRDDEKRDHVRTAARDYVEQQFGPDVAVDRLLSAYRTHGLLT